MTYESKKDPTVTAAFDFEDTKCNTTRLIYLTGDKAGQSFVVSNSTLKRWWRKIKTEEKVIEKTDDNPLGLDFEQINTPYPEPKEQKYIPKPQSVIEYEESKKRNKCTFALPKDYDEFANILADKNIALKKVNKGYISLSDNSKLKLLTNGIGVLASNELGEQLTLKGMKCRECIEKGTPFRFDIKDESMYNEMYNVLASLYKNQNDQ
jgi:hypothetical protein